MFVSFFKVLNTSQNEYSLTGRSRDFENGGGATLYGGHHCWLMKKIFSFRWSKMAKITIETISFW